MRINHPDAGRYDSGSPEDEPTGPTVRDLHGEADRTLASLDDEVDRLTKERDELADFVRGLMGWVELIGHGDGKLEQHTSNHRYVDAKAALAKLESES